MSLPPKDDPGQWNHDWSWAFGSTTRSEEFVPIPGLSADHYRITKKGRFWKDITPKGERRYKYLYVTAKDERGHRHFLLHELVLRTFVGPRPPGMHCCHKDDDAWNNSVENLRYDTIQENIKDRERNGKTACGSRKKSSKLKEEDIPEILRLFREGMTILKIARRYNVSDCPIRAIVQGRAWRHIPRGPFDYPTDYLASKDAIWPRDSPPVFVSPKTQDG